MRLLRFLLLALGLGLLWAPAAQAYRFGTDESIQKIQDVDLQGPDGESLFVGYMTRTQYFLLGLYVEDAGYVLGVNGNGNSKRFFRMPEGETLRGMQQNGALPDPLPPYKLSAFDYVIGYSLWWALVIVAVYMMWDSRRKKAEPAVVAPGAVPPQAVQPLPVQPLPVQPLPAGAAAPLTPPPLPTPRTPPGASP